MIPRESYLFELLCFDYAEEFREVRPLCHIKRREWFFNPLHDAKVVHNDETSVTSSAHHVLIPESKTIYLVSYD